MGRHDDHHQHFDYHHHLHYGEGVYYQISATVQMSLKKYLDQTDLQQYQYQSISINLVDAD